MCVCVCQLVSVSEDQTRYPCDDAGRRADVRVSADGGRRGKMGETEGGGGRWREMLRRVGQGLSFRLSAVPGAISHQTLLP